MKTSHTLIVKNEPTFAVAVEKIPRPEPKADEVLIRVQWSAVNYKDALALSERGGVLRQYPMTPGIDLAGVIVESRDSQFPEGLPVLVTGFGLGVSHPGGLSEYQAVPTSWLVPLPETMSLREAALIGTAGFTAALALRDVVAKTTPEQAVAVTGASGGVGSFAIALLSQLGYQNITGVSRKKGVANQLKKLGATEIIQPEHFITEKPRPLSKQEFHGVIDTVGGDLLAQILPTVYYGGVAALCGNAGGIKLTTTVLPFILRGITLAGIDSVNVPMTQRVQVWQELAQNLHFLQNLPVTEVSLFEVPQIAQALLAGTHSGRTIVRM